MEKNYGYLKAKISFNTRKTYKINQVLKIFIYLRNRY
jgi:hypothetical protein